MSQWVTLRDLLHDHPTAFAKQSWYLGEPFLERRLGRHLERPRAVKPTGEVPDPHKCPTAVELAECYLRFPAEDVWRGFLWCKDSDQWGQRIFVGGLAMRRGFAGAGFQIHRLVSPTIDWGLCVW